jgi:hypothetical protein
MTIQTSTQTANTPANRKSSLPFTAMFVSAGLCVICSKHRRIARSLPMILAIATLAFGTLSLAGCGGGTTMSTGTGQQSKSYVITVTGTSPSTPDATTTFTLVVQ